MRSSPVRVARSLATGLALILAVACTETADDAADVATDDARVVDAGADVDAGRSPGAPCDADLDCAGVCRVDAADPAGGRRCFVACAAGCPSDTVCVDGACVAAPPMPGDEGADCSGGAPCAAGLSCSGDHPDGQRCALTCADDADCAEDARCAAHRTPSVCLPPAAAVFGCPALPCARADLQCLIDEEDGGGTCVALCGVEGARCPEGGDCVRQPDGALLCVPTGDGPVGAPCASGGDAACAEGLACRPIAAGDEAPRCTRACERLEDCCPAGDCDDVACRRPAGGDGPVCMPAPFGRGDEQGGPDADCAAHGATDCAPALDCVDGVADRRVCAAPCAGLTCAAGFVCVARGAQMSCLRGDAAGGPGTPCPSGEGCADTCVEAERPETRYCTVACDGGDCPADFGCRDGLCRLGAMPQQPDGAACPPDGAAGCAGGVCVADPQGGGDRCTRPCEPDGAPCEAPLICRAIDGGSFCLPGD